MTFKQYIVLLLLVLSPIAASFFIEYQQGNQAPKAGSIDVPIYAIATSSPVSVTTSSTSVIGTSTSRRFFYLQNTDATYPAYCAFNDAPAIFGRGFFIAASSTFMLPFGDGTMYAGAIRCIAGQTITLLVSQA